MTRRRRAELALVEPSEPRWKIVHETPGRIRFAVPTLRTDRTMAARLSETLGTGEGIGRVRTNTAAGSLVVHYDDPALTAYGSAVHDGTYYIAVSDYESDIWVMDLEW